MTHIKSFNASGFHLATKDSSMTASL